MHTNPNPQWILYKSPAVNSNSKPYLDKTSRSSWLSKFWQILINAFTTTGEPQIYQMRDSAGSLWWRIYDPVSGQNWYMDSEEEVCIWLDQHYRVN